MTVQITSLYHDSNITTTFTKTLTGFQCHEWDNMILCEVTFHEPVSDIQHH